MLAAIETIQRKLTVNSAPRRKTSPNGEVFHLLCVLFLSAKVKEVFFLVHLNSLLVGKKMVVIAFYGNV